MHGPDVEFFFTCKEQKQGGEIIQFYYSDISL